MTKIIILFVSLLLVSSCLKDDPTIPLELSINGSYKLLQQIEENGDPINASDFSHLINADVLYRNLDEYIIVDLRPSTDFNNGHIENSINISPDNLISFIDTAFSKSKIVLISSTGQAAAYYASLLKLMGTQSIYSLHFGMASWNSDFSDPWDKAILTDKGSLVRNTFNNIDYPRSEFSPLPNVDLTSMDIQIAIRDRVSLLISLSYSFVKNSRSTDYLNSDLSTNISDVYNNFDYSKKSFNDIYIICIPKIEAYIAGRGLDSPAHPPTTVLYKLLAPYYELTSSNYLQTIPSNKNIVIYDYDGEIAASLCAYLNLLGYNSKFIGYGLSSFNKMVLSLDKRFDSIPKNSFPYIK